MTKKITRRDAIKLLGAAVGATALANLPSRWSKPELVSGVLPVHAQTSCLALELQLAGNTGGSVENNGPIWDIADIPNGYVAWSCQTGCILLSFWLLNGIGSGSVQITTLSGSFTLNLDAAGVVEYVVLIDLGTGDSDYTSTPGVTLSAGSCTFVLPGDISADRAPSEMRIFGK